jgi:probable rRNA maturation factor
MPPTLPAYAIDIQDETGADALPLTRLEQAIAEVLAHHHVAAGTGLALVITDDAQVQQMNAQYRGVDAATDILSFPADPLPDEIAAEVEEPPYLGDLIVAYPYTQRHAAEAGHDLDDELVLLAIHGTLHLLGYDHDNPDNQQKMWNAQQRALDVANVAIDVPLFMFGDESDA